MLRGKTTQRSELDPERLTAKLAGSTDNAASAGVDSIVGSLAADERTEHSSILAKEPFPCTSPGA